MSGAIERELRAQIAELTRERNEALVLLNCGEAQIAALKDERHRLIAALTSDALTEARTERERDEARAQIEELKRERDEKAQETQRYILHKQDTERALRERAEAAERERDALRERLAEAETALRLFNENHASPAACVLGRAYFTKHGD